MERCRAIVLDMVDQVETGHQKAKPLMEMCNLYPYCQETLLPRNNMGILTSNILDAKPTYKFSKIQDQLTFPLCAELSLTVLDMVDQVETGHQKAKPLMEMCNLYPYCQETLLPRNNMGILTSNILDAKPTYKFSKIQDQLTFPLCAELSLTVLDIIRTPLSERPKSFGAGEKLPIALWLRYGASSGNRHRCRVPFVPFPPGSVLAGDPQLEQQGCNSHTSDYD